MVGGGKFELVVNGLANSPAFQRFAVKTSKRMEDLSSKAIQKRLTEQMKDLSKNFEIDCISRKHQCRCGDASTRTRVRGV